jgi:Arc/MetJ-type ribon-helix-helix transcriptional regulator
MKVSVSLPNGDVEYLDAYAKEQGIESRSAVLQKAVRLLRASELAADYEAAFTDVSESADANLWDATVGDGLSD